MRRLLLLSVMGVAMLFSLSTTSTAQYKDDDYARPKASDSAPTFNVYSTNGNYHQGDLVVRNYQILGGSAGPFASITGHNPGLDPAIDSVDWAFLPAGAGVQLQPPTALPKGLIMGSVTSLVVTSNPQVCAPLTQPPSTFSIASMGGSWCSVGALSTLPITLSGSYSVVVDVSPKVPSDGSYLSFTIFDATEWANGAFTSASCNITSGGSECVTTLIADPWTLGDTVGFQVVFSPGTQNLPSLTVTSAHWSVVALP